MASVCPDSQDAQDTVRRMLCMIGEDPDREGLVETPQRVVRSWQQLFAGYEQDPAALLKTFTEGACDEMVVLAGIRYYSMCEHHILPFFGTVDVGYIPDGKIVGISKLARLVDAFSRRLQVQERMTTQIADTIDTELKPKGVMVVCRGQHFCMAARGVQKHESRMITSALRGAFANEQSAREEFMLLCARQGD